MASVRGIAAEAATAIVERLTGKAPERATVEAALSRALPS
jgi:F-type H+-transporting ATPase subunit b